VPLVKDAKAAGLITTCHTGGSSIPGSGAITGDHLLKMHPHVSFHINGGPTAMPDADFERVIKESEIALQVCTAGNLRTVLLCARLADQSAPSTVSSWGPIRRPAPASCRSACSIRSPIAPA
jgi:enamidase